ncbi:MAG TPA: GDSL-type esterase/lipase family protein [Bryobacteraceae bacterium]|jgi:lysophospholipase L1-like esterase|nr:GDSL-type esterase/lipase family protein [Bryobacteraceae bacterium]
MRPVIPVKTTLTVLTFAALLLVPQAFPSLKNYMSIEPKSAVAVLTFPIKPAATEALIDPLASPASLNATLNKRLVAKAPRNLSDPAHVLDHFYEALLKGEGVHIIHYGDSPTTADLITADARALLQHEFGDGGVGFVLMARPWAWYNHRGIDMSGSNWKIDVGGNSTIKDGLNGLGAVSFRGAPGAVSHWKVKTAHRSVEIAYLVEPQGGVFEVEADGNPIGTGSSTVAPGEHPFTPGYATFDIPPGTAEIGLKVTSGSVRFYGADFRKGPGVVYSSLGINGANVTLLSNAFNEAHWAAQLRHYKPDLIIVNYGTNESGFPNFVDSTWGHEMRKTVARLQRAVPEASILLMSPMDRGAKGVNGEIATISTMPRLVATESKIAADTGVAFFDTFEAMGGSGTMGRWYTSEPRLVGSDYIHPMPAGARIVGELLFSALREGFTQFKMEQLKQNIIRQANSTGREASRQP